MRSRNEIKANATYWNPFCFHGGRRSGADTSDSGGQEALKHVVTNFENSWTKCDAKALAELWTPDGDFENPYNFVAKGRSNIEKFYAAAFSAGYCGSKGTGALDAIRFVKRDVAIIDGTCDIQGAHNPSGHQIREETGRFKAVAIKRSGKWWIGAQRGMIPATPPRN